MQKNNKSFAKIFSAYQKYYNVREQDKLAF